MNEQKEHKRHTFNEGELQRMEYYLKEQTAHREIIGMLDNFSYSFADWSILINEAVHDAMAKKQQLNMNCEKERKMLADITFLFTKLAYHSKTLSDWHNQLIIGTEQTKTMIEQGHP